MKTGKERKYLAITGKLALYNINAYLATVPVTEIKVLEQLYTSQQSEGWFEGLKSRVLMVDGRKWGKYMSYVVKE